MKPHDHFRRQLPHCLFGLYESEHLDGIDEFGGEKARQLRIRVYIGKYYACYGISGRKRNKTRKHLFNE